MKRKLYILFLATILISCERYPEPISQIVEDFNANIIGNFQSAEGNEYLPLEVGAQIEIKSVHPLTDLLYRMEMQVSSGNGSVDNETVLCR